MRIADIVLVEDTHDDVAIALRIFERHLPGYRVHVLQDGAEALRWVRELDRRGISEQPKVIFLDLSLPGADGFRILEELRSRPDDATHPSHRPELERARVGSRSKLCAGGQQLHHEEVR